MKFDINLRDDEFSAVGLFERLAEFVSFNVADLAVDGNIARLTDATHGLTELTRTPRLPGDALPVRPHIRCRNIGTTAARCSGHPIYDVPEFIIELTRRELFS